MAKAEPVVQGTGGLHSQLGRIEEKPKKSTTDTAGGGGGGGSGDDSAPLASDVPVSDDGGNGGSDGCACGHDHGHGHNHGHGHSHGHNHGHGHGQAGQASEGGDGQASGLVPPGLSKVKQIIAVASGKGGVGKSTVTVNLAYAYAAAGAKVGILDTDVYGPSIPGMLGLADRRLSAENALPDGRITPVEAHKLKLMSMGFMTTPDTPIIWRGPMASQLIQQFIGGIEWGELDYLFIDLPPGTGDIQLTLSQAIPLTGALIVTTPNEIAKTIAEKGLRMFETVKVPILGIVENMSFYACPECGHTDHVFQTGGGQRAAKDLNLPLLAQIPLNSQVAQAADEGVPLLAKDAESAVTTAYGELAEALDKQLEEQARLEAANKHAPKNVQVTAEGLLSIQWADGEQALVTPRTLRQACPCASCVEEWTGKQILDPASVPDNIRIEQLQPVGRYALRFVFSDSHGSGLYGFDTLRQLGEEKPAQAPEAIEEFAV